MAALYEIGADLRRVIEGGMIIDEDTGEIMWDKTNIEELEAKFDDKLEACALYVKNLEAEAAAIATEEKALASRRKQAEKKAVSLKDYIAYCLKDKKDCKFSTARVALSFRKSQSIVIEDETKLAKRWFARKVVLTPDKIAIKEALKSGSRVKGAQIVQNEKLQIK